jgi:hypothetical protein
MPTIEEVKGDFDCVANFAAWKFPTGPAGNIAQLRIQTAAKSVNGFAKAIRRQTESRPECETQGDFQPARRDGR